MSHTVSWDGYTESFNQILTSLTEAKISEITFLDPEFGDFTYIYTPAPQEAFCTICAEDNLDQAPSLPLSAPQKPSQTTCAEHLWIEFENPDLAGVTYTLK